MDMAMTASRISAAVCLVRGEGRERECYLVRRNPELRFLGGFWAFPGGTLDEADHQEGDADALERCARRELFEECGVLAGDGAALPAAELGALRRALLEGTSSALEEARAALASSFGPAGLALTEIARIETPPFVPRRYDTVFYLAQIPAGVEPSIVHGELVDGCWLRPDVALARWMRGELWIAPPVRYLLEELAGSQDLTSFVQRAAQEAASFAKGALHPIWFVPGLFLAPLRTATLPPATTTNCFVLGRERLYVIDPASPEPDEKRRLFAWLDARIAGGAHVEAVLVTHGHADHIGAVVSCCDRYDVPLAAHPRTQAQIESGTVRRRELQGGEQLPLGVSPDGRPGWHVEVHDTPGHHPGHLCFVESRYGAAVLGDLVSTTSTIVIDPPEGHLRTYLGSLERMHAVLLAAGSMAFPAHGPPAPAGAALLAEFLRHRQQREDRLLLALHQGMIAESELLRFVYDDVSTGLHRLAARSLAAGLQKLEEDGRIVRSDSGWRLR